MFNYNFIRFPRRNISCNVAVKRRERRRENPFLFFRMVLLLLLLLVYFGRLPTDDIHKFYYFEYIAEASISSLLFRIFISSSGASLLKLSLALMKRGSERSWQKRRRRIWTKKHFYKQTNFLFELKNVHEHAWSKNVCVCVCHCKLLLLWL